VAGHNPGGSSTVENGLMIDLSLLNQVTVDPVAKLARAGGGALLGQLDAAAQEHGLATPAGMISHIRRRRPHPRRWHGVADRQVRAQQSTTSCRFRWSPPMGSSGGASDDENPDLFWAIRGGGGNFGVVDGIRVRPARGWPMIQFGVAFWDLDRGADCTRWPRGDREASGRVNVVVGAVSARRPVRPRRVPLPARVRR
jgi:FAD/FMN-containing dehydrogenase